jgi:hypothetical protein
MLALIAATGCTPDDPAELVGEWHFKRDNLTGTPEPAIDPAAVLALAADGTFAATRLPRGIFCVDGDRLAPISGRGEWESYPDANRVTLVMHAAPGCGRLANVMTDVDPSGTILVWFPDGIDGGRHVLFSR